ncbi:choice-of-anchor M domain-containing protein [Glycomyces sp. YM15]|uniref:choice-of-anchor M domain-containing protein n=1 Tax=Glycomyces sp. YM15 TaxID=2800446 RepID=UPI001966384E|nr:choice-of-anchor M domain-containing protein [Glycomyces sp. YM15]
MTLTSALPRAGALAAALLLTALAAPPASAQTGDRTVLSVGHTDAMQVHLDGGRLKLRVKDDTGDETRYHHPDDVLFQVLPEAKATIPEGGLLDFVGKAGDPVWILPFTQDHSLLWAGWSTEPLKSGQLEDNRIQMTLAGAEGPGDLVLWSPGNLGGNTVHFNTRDGLPDSINVNVNSHVHSSWGFTAEGEYTLTWKVSGTLADGTPVASQEYDYQWVVGDLPGEDPDPVDPDPDPGTPGLDDRLVLETGHVDVFNSNIEDDGTLTLNLKDGSGVHDGGAVYRDPDDVVFFVPPRTKTTLSEGLVSQPGWETIGAAGDPVWILPDTEMDGLLFAGWSTEQILASELASDSMSLVFSAVEGPGDLLMYQVDDFGGAAVLVDSSNGLPDAIGTQARTHAHANWIFTKPGVYTLTWQVETTLADGTAVASTPEEYVFVVEAWPADDPNDPDDPGNPDLEHTQTITATVDTDAGGLVISVDPNDRDVVLPALALDSTATRWTTEGELRPVTVTDTRSADPGWNVAAQVSEFAGDAGGFSGSHLGWLPGVVSTGDSQQVTPGAAVQGELDGGPGLSTSQILAAAAAGSGKGTCVLGADLRLDLPTDVESGTYTALVTFTAI